MSASRWLEEARKADPMPPANSANSANSPLLALTALTASGTETQNQRHCVICDAALDDTYIAIWTGGNVCPTGPCLQRALDRADDNKETPPAVRAYAERLSGEGS